MVSIVTIPISPMDDSTIQRRLLRVEQNLLDSVTKGPQALKSFYESWATLGRDIECAIRNRKLGSDTCSLVKVVSARVEVLAEAFIETHSHIHSLTDDLMGELNDALTQFGLSEDHSIPTTSDRHPKKMQQYVAFFPSVRCGFLTVGLLRIHC